MSDPDRILEEVRRQGRAAVAAQSTAEACLMAVERLEARLEAIHREAVVARSGGDGTGSRVEPPKDDVARLVERLLPALDALDRIHREVERSGPRGALLRDGLLGWVVRGRGPDLARGLRLLRAQLDEALASAGIEVDRDENVAFDESRHRVVERRLVPGVGGPRVIEILAPGYRVGGRQLREAQVVVALESSS